MKTLLVITHAPTPTTQAMAEASVRIASDRSLFGDRIAVRQVPALEAVDPQIYLDADAYLFGTPVNFGYISGALKHSFDSTYNDLLGKVAGRPFSYWMHGRSDATGAQRALTAITTGLELNLATAPVVRLGEVGDSDLEDVAELGGTLAALLDE